VSDETVPSSWRKVWFTNGCYVQRGGTDPQAIVRPGKVTSDLSN
jgi:hypothetical protein